IVDVGTRVAGAGKQYDFGLMTDGETETNGEVRFQERVAPLPTAPRLQPSESTRRILEAPRLNQFERLRQEGSARPYEQVATGGRRQFLDRQRDELDEGHRLVVALVIAPATWVLRLDRRVRAKVRRRIDDDGTVIVAPQPNEWHRGGQDRLQSRRVDDRGVHWPAPCSYFTRRPRT